MASQKRVGVVLAGCGYVDGAEIQEATCTLLSLDRRGAKLATFAPDVVQTEVADHVTGVPVSGEKRRVLQESARIVRGKIADLAKASAKDLDALVFPGGFGVAKNLCTFAAEGRNMRVLPEVERVVREMRAAGKPMGFICIAPVIAAKIFGPEKVRVTIGNDRDTAAAIESWGARHVDCKVEDVVVDERLEVVSTPAYMLGPWIAPVATGIDKLISAVLEMA